ncbi:MAG: hypothetical protein ACPG4U_04795 [Pseudomonadales bacterium]
MKKLKSLLAVALVTLFSIVMVMSFATLGLALLGFAVFALAVVAIYRKFSPLRDDSVVRTY